MEIYRVSVRDLVSFSSSKGDLGGAPLSASRAQLGSKEHRRIQESRGEGYEKEYSLKTQIEESNIIVEIYGRADGIYVEENPPVIEEIKTVQSLSDWKESHWAQVKVYAYLYMIELQLQGKECDQVGIKLLYIDISDSSEKDKTLFLNQKELKEYFDSLIYPYITILKKEQLHEGRRNDSLNALTFPFESFRKGQREFSVDVYRAIRDEETLFSLAPTGTGKSMATLFPALKAMGEGHSSKIFYLTAKTVGRKTARDTLNIIREKKETYIKSIIITAKEKSCINSEFNCKPEVCPYAKGYYERLDGVMKELEGVEDFYQENLAQFGKKYTLCPFELSLDLSLLCDVIICDYNYVFDLKVQLKRYFDSVRGKYTLLVDESHNLPDRLRSAYSAKIIREEVNPVIDIVKYESERVADDLEKISDYLLELRDGYKGSFIDDFIKEDEVPVSLIRKLRSCTVHCEQDLLNKEFKAKKVFLDLYYNLLFFIKLSELFSEGHKFLVEDRGGLGVGVEIFCIDPSYLLSKVLGKTSSQVFFSGTLYPLNYYTDMLIRDRVFRFSRIPSPFDQNQLALLVRDDIRTTYRERGRYYMDVAKCIKDVYETKKGNYMVFFPSYSYMNEVRQLMDIEVHIQEQGMSEQEREAYLELFHNSDGVLSFAIMGGVFGEGIDLVGDSLIGVVVVGVGLPGISYYGNLIKEYYNYNYAYTFPGFNKVVQAVGRVIRDSGDRGVAVLLDSRFNSPLYRSLYPQEWSHVKYLRDEEKMMAYIKGFYDIV